MIALCVGHSRPNDSGASSVTGVSEWDYNSELAEMIGDKLRQPHKIYSTYQGNGYVSAMRWLARKLDEDRVDVAVELHFNAASPKATGHEWLYWNTSEKGRLLARSIRDSFEDSFPLLTSRGIKGRQKGSRGAMFLRATSMPACIAEPFFGTNEEDWELALKHKEGVADAIAGGLTLYKELAERW
jgi:N-acetylmuramoyl-L-alanine amidase